MEQKLSNEYTAILVRVTGERNDRIESFCKTCPAYRKLREEYLRLSNLAARAAVEGEGFGEADANRKAFAKEMEEKQAELLKEHGLPEDYLDIHYQCEICKDTGYVGDAERKLCACAKQKIEAQRKKELESTPSFEEFNENIYPADEQRAAAIRLRDKLVEYAEGFPNNEKPFLFLQSVAGLGKTFLISCTARRVAKRGYSVRFLTSYELAELFREQHMGGPKHTKALAKVDFLVIDDLGVEPVFRNITLEYLFMVLNERSRYKRPTAVSTNLTLQELQNKYGERILSRLMDKELGRYYVLKGQDLRLFKPKED